MLVQTFFWLALSAWLGCVLVVAIAAPVIFDSVQDANPILPDVLRVNLENEHSSLLAQSIIGNILETLSNVQYACAGVLLVMLVGQWGVMHLDTLQIIMGVARDVLYVGAVVLLVYDRRVLWKKAWGARQEFIDHADEPDIANPAKDRFDRYHHESVRVLSAIFGILSLIVVLSAGVRPGW